MYKMQKNIILYILGDIIDINKTDLGINNCDNQILIELFGIYTSNYIRKCNKKGIKHHNSIICVS